LLLFYLGIFILPLGHVATITQVGGENKLDATALTGDWALSLFGHASSATLSLFLGHTVSKDLISFFYSAVIRL